MICPTCSTVLHKCPECGERGHYEKFSKRHTRYGCVNGHVWHEKGGEVVTVRRGRPPKPAAQKPHGKARRQRWAFDQLTRADLP